MSRITILPTFVQLRSFTMNTFIITHELNEFQAIVTPKMTDSKYFTTTKKGEIFELKSELNSEKKEKKREAVKKVRLSLPSNLMFILVCYSCSDFQVIASMTVGKDVSALFPDVVNCMQTDNLELKKLVYLYLMNYAKSHPDMAIMAVNTFVKVKISLPEEITAI